MNCPRCGTQNQDADSFCSYCGQDLRPAQEYLRPPAAPAVRPAAGAYAPPTPQQPATPQQAPGPQYPPQTYRPPVNPTPASLHAPSQQVPANPWNPAVQAPVAPVPAAVNSAAATAIPAPPPDIPSYRGWASGLLACCWPAWPAALAALVYAGRVESSLAARDLVAAKEASRRALFWCWMTGVIGLALWVAILSLVAFHLT